MYRIIVNCPLNFYIKIKIEILELKTFINSILSIN